MNQKDHYRALDGLRAYSAAAIVLMHVWYSGGYELDGFFFEDLIPELTNLVFLFMVISAFSMCCGYYEKFRTQSISLEQFYSKRYAKIWPFFAALCLLDLVVSPSAEAFYEVFANLTLCFGLLDKDISVVGVGWFLGVAFAFYMMFPFFCYLISNRRRAWFSLIVMVLFNILCADYFGIDRTNILYCAMFFLAGGLVYLYRRELGRLAGRLRWVLLGLCGAVTVLYFVLHTSVVTILIVCVVYLVYAMGVSTEGLLINPVTRFLSGISLEIYLCHMAVYRILEKLNLLDLLDLFENELLSFVVTFVVIFLGAVVCAAVGQRVIGYGMKALGSLLQKRNKQAGSAD